MRGPRGERHAAMQAKRCASGLRHRQPPASRLRSPLARGEGNLPLPELGKKGDPGPKSPESGECRLEPISLGNVTLFGRSQNGAHPDE